MNLKKILVLVMTLAMLVVTCAPALSTFAAEDNDDITIENALDNADNYVRENIDEAYAYAWAYISDNGYLDNALTVLAEVIEAVELLADEAENDENVMPRLIDELNATVATLEEIESLIASGDVNTFAGLVSNLEALKADLDSHIDNLEHLYNDTYVAFSDVENAIAIIDELAQDLVYVAAGYVCENINVIYNNAPVVAESVVEALIWVHSYAGVATEEVAPLVIETLEKALEIANGIYNEDEEAIEFAANLVKEVANAIAGFNAEHDNVLSDNFTEVFGITAEQGANLLIALCVVEYENAVEVYGDIIEEVLEVAEEGLDIAIELYGVIMNVIADAHDNADNVVLVTSQIFSYVYDFVVENNIASDLNSHLDNLVNIIAATYGETKDVEAVASEIYDYVLDMFADTFETNYTITVESAYVSLGNAVYGQELANMLHLENKYTNFAFGSEATLKGADLITIRVDNGDFVEFITNNLSNLGKNINWTGLLDAEGQAALDAILASAKANLIESGAAEELVVVVEALLNNIADIDAEYVADLVAYGIESTLYSYAKFLSDLDATLETINTVAPNATVVITGAQNPFVGVELGEYEALVDAAMTVFNTQLVAIAYANDNVIFVDSVDAADIYAALNAVCAHHYDNVCTDTVCSICGETRVAPGHDWSDWTVTKAAQVGVKGEEKRTCKVCDHEETREIEALKDTTPVVTGPVDDGNSPVVGIVIAIVAIAACAAGYYFYTKKKNQK